METDERVAASGRKVSLAMKGRRFSEDHKRKIGDALRGRVGWNRGLTAGTDPRIRGGFPPWNAGLTKETDERVARNAQGVREWWARIKLNDPEGWKALCEANRARTREKTARRLRAEYGLPDDARFVPVRFSEHMLARSLIAGSKAIPRSKSPGRAVKVIKDKRFYYPYKGGIFPVEDEEFGLVDGVLVPLVVVNGVTRTRALKLKYINF